MTQLRSQVREELAFSGFEHPNREADLLLSAILQRSLGDIELDHLMGRDLASEDINRVLRATRSRARREPLQHLAGTAPCYGYDFQVGPGVFVPRPETELLIDFGLNFLRGREWQASQQQADAPLVADLGAGSGAIAVSIAASLPDARVIAYEGSPFALPWLVRNIRSLAPQVRVEYGDWHERIHADSTRRFTAILSNPPYVPAGDIPADPEVRLFDPEMALYSGSDGLDDIRRIAQTAAQLLLPGGLVAVEHTESQGSAVREIFSEAGLIEASTERDLTDRDRFSWARYPALPA
ncbi:peptide chain release factor N(5)-glutamine methyltransferase [Gulosibacter chungangensis]|nr:peptide chain release factor N(5)-glutamine methyltransferase [Gulosibacter chungangensis]